MGYDNFKIAVVTPVYNAGSTISDSIKSLKAQTFTQWIHIIVNDGSTDDTLKIIEEETLDDSRFEVISYSSNKGRGYARNIALKKVIEIGVPFMCMLDADDYYYPEKLDIQLKFMQKYHDISLMSTSMGLVDLNMNLQGVIGKNSSKISFFSFSKFENYIPVPHASSIIRVSDIGDITFDEGMKLSQDQDFMIRVLYNKNYAFLSKITYLYSRELSFSPEKYKSALNYKLLTLHKIGLKKSQIRKRRIVNLLKSTLLTVIFYLGLYKTYLRLTSVKPTINQINEHELWLKTRNVYDQSN